MEPFVAALLVLTVVLLLVKWTGPLITKIKQRRRIWQLLKDMPEPFCLPIVGHLLDYNVSQEKLWHVIRKQAKDFNYNIWKIWGLGIVSVNFVEPDYVEALMNTTKHTDKAYIYKFLQPWLNEGLLTSKGAKWQNRRKILTPSFHFHILQVFNRSFDKHSDWLIDQLKLECTKDYSIPINFITEFALKTLCETTMGIDVDTKQEMVKQYRNAIIEFAEVNVHRIFQPWLFADFIYFNLHPNGWKTKEIIRVLKRFTHTVIRERLETWDNSKLDENTNMVVTASGKRRLAMLDLLISQMKSGADITYEGICEEVDTFMFEGHDTSSAGMAAAMLLLANYPDVQERVHEEAKGILTGKKEVTTDDLAKMVYLEMVIKETLRLYPPVPYIARQLVEDLDIKDYIIPSGTMANIPIYDVHRNPKYWPNPEVFDPERFSVENSTGRHPFSYIPFSAGMRNCIGQKFAMMELKMMLSKVIFNYRLLPIDTEQTIDPILDMIFRTKRNIRLIIRPRN